jgi:hypothetical protein
MSGHSHDESTPTLVPRYNEFKRPLNTAILKLSCPVDVPKANLKTTMVKVLQDSGIANSNYLIHGPDIGRWFELVWETDQRSAVLRCSQIWSNQRNGKEFKQWHLESTVAGQQTKVYINLDKNRAMVRMEVVTKKLHESMSASHPLLQLSMVRRLGIIKWGAKCLARVVCHSEENTKLSWVGLNATGAGVDRAIWERFIQELPEANNVAWESCS